LVEFQYLFIKKKSGKISLGSYLFLPLRYDQNRSDSLNLDYLDRHLGLGISHGESQQKTAEPANLDDGGRKQTKEGHLERR